MCGGIFIYFPSFQELIEKNDIWNYVFIHLFNKSRFDMK